VPTAAEVASVVSPFLKTLRAELGRIFPDGVRIADGDTLEIIDGSTPIEIVDFAEPQSVAERALRGLAERLLPHQTADGRFDVSEEQLQRMLDGVLRNATQSY
jgi:hypothetical protein